jgi:transcriptional regulator with GAF, ATPase, and Fis domain
VRELQNTIERALILAQNGLLSFDIPKTADQPASAPPAAAPSPANAAAVLTDTEFQQRERDNMLVALTKARWKIHGPGGAAELLGLKPTTLISRLKKLGLKKPVKDAD